MYKFRGEEVARTRQTILSIQTGRCMVPGEMRAVSFAVKPTCPVCRWVGRRFALLQSVQRDGTPSTAQPQAAKSEPNH